MGLLKKIMPKKAFGSKRAVHKSTRCLELTIKNNSGQYRKLSLPVRTICVQEGSPYKTDNFVKRATLSTQKNNSGQYRKLPLSVRRILVREGSPYKTENFVKVLPLSTCHIKIEGIESRYIAQEMLLNRRIRYVIGNQKLEGTIMGVVSAPKGPEGIPGPAPPPLN